jgi:hypothetical protein
MSDANIYRLSDVITSHPEPWNMLLQQYSTTNLNAFGAIVQVDPALSAKARSTPNMGILTQPYMNDITGDVNISNDDPAQIAPVAPKTTFGKMYMTVMRRNRVEGQMDLVWERMKGTVDPMQTVVNELLGPFWMRHYQETMFSILSGVVAKNIASYSSDAVLDVSAGTDATHPRYTSYLVAPGAIKMGFGAPKRPVEFWREPDSGNGGGGEKMISRVELIMHPNGWSWASSNDNPTNTDLATSSNWTRPWELKNAQYWVAIKHNNLIDSGDSSPGAGNLLTPQTLIRAEHKLGDVTYDRNWTLVVHSDTIRALRELDLITDMRYSDQPDKVYPSYRGMRVVVSDSLPVETA